MAKADFIKNFRTARNLFIHGPARAVSAGGQAVVNDQAYARTAIWCTPKSVAGFDPNDFKELSDQKRAELADAVDDFLQAVQNIAPGSFPTAAELSDAMPPFEQLMRLLEPYMFYPNEVAAVEKSLGSLLPLPDWIVNWDFEVKEDFNDQPAVYLAFYVDESSYPRKKLGETATHLFSRISALLRSSGLQYWPYVRFHYVSELAAA